MHQYKLISKKGEGTFSEVLKAQHIKTGNFVAIKCMKTHFNSIEQVNQLREIQALRKTSPHPHIIKLIEVLYDEPTGRLALVTELMDMNMYELIKDRKTYLAQAKVKLYIYQLFKSIDHMHKKGIFHRDIKPENILIINDHVKLADLGSCRGTKGEHPYTEYISTRWYRSPECLMTDGYYDQMMDIWGAGCVMYEILTLVPLFPGKNELDMIHRIHNVLGTPAQEILDRFKSHASHMEFNFPQKTGTGLEKLLPHASADCIDLLKQLLTYDPERRITADQVLKHEYFRELAEAERHAEFQTTLSSSTRFSPSSKQLLHSLYNESEKSTTFHHDKSQEKSGNHHLGMKKMRKKSKENGSGKFPTLNVNLKVEGIFKSSQYNDSSMEDEPDKGGILPPLKHASSSGVQLETKVLFNTMNHPMKKKDEPKKFANASMKPQLTSIYAQKKPNKSMLPPNEYMMVGRKAG